MFLCKGSFTLTETDSDLDSKPDGYIVLYRTCLHYTDKELDPFSAKYRNPSPSP